jgi:hypothetical protein
LEPGYTEFRDELLPEGVMALWDPSAMVMIQGPIATAQYRDEYGNTNMMITDKWKMTTKDKIRIAHGGHIITKDSDGNLKVFCKRMFLKLGKKRIPVPHKFYATVTDELEIYIACAVCARFVQVREQLIDYQWNPKLEFPHMRYADGS